MRRLLLKSFVAAGLLSLVCGIAWGDTWTLVTSVNEITTSGEYLLVTNDKGYAASGTVSNKTLTSIAVTESNGSIVTDVNASGKPYSFTLASASSTGKYYICLNGDYLSNTSSTDLSMATAKSKASEWTFTLESTGTVLIQNASNSNRFLGETSTSSHQWKAYATSNLGSYLHPYIYKKVLETTYSVTLADVDGGTLKAQVDNADISRAAAGKTVSLSVTPHPHYSFTAWDVYKTDDATVKVVVTNNAFTMPDYDVTVSATFTADPQSAIVYRANGGTGDDVTVAQFIGETVSIDACPFTYSGYAFTLWNTMPDGTGTDYHAGDSYTVTAQNLVLYAMWKVGSSVTYDFTQMPDFSVWDSQYAEHTVMYPESDVVFACADKNTTTIKDRPVTKGDDVEIVAADGRMMSKASFECLQWGTKEQTITMYYSTDGGETYTAMDGTSSEFSIEKDLPSGTNAVKITFSQSDNQVGISKAVVTFTAPTVNTITVPVSSYKYATVCFRRNVVVPAANTVYYLASATNGVLAFNALDKDVVVEAGVGLLLFSESGNVTFQYTDEEATFTSADVDATSCLVGMRTSNIIVYAKVSGSSNYILSIDKNDNFGFCAPNLGQFNTTVGKAYLHIPTPSVSGEALTIRIGDTTLTEQMLQENEHADIYDLLGRKVDVAGKGIYIVNGRKVCIK